MSLEKWDADPEAENKGLMGHIKDDVFSPLLSAPVNLTRGTFQAAEYVGSRAKIELDRVKKMTKTIIDAEERNRTYGSGGEWRRWVRDNFLYINGTPLHRDILANLPSGITVALVSAQSVS